jgi:hypothetical protein
MCAGGQKGEKKEGFGLIVFTINAIDHHLKALGVVRWR